MKIFIIFKDKYFFYEPRTEINKKSLKNIILILIFILNKKKIYNYEKKSSIV